MDVIFVRHGEAESNVLPPYKNRVGSDRPLTREGQRQIKRTAQTLATLALDQVISLPDMIYSSPYRRTRQSAAIIDRWLHLPVVIDDRLREIDKGSLVGKTVEAALEYENGVPDDKRPTDRPPAGENWLDIAQRMTDFIIERERHDETSLIVVSHNHPIECAVGKLTGQPLGTWGDRPIDNASISQIIRRDDSWSIDESLYNYLPY